jgi:hypothetical protein
MIAYSVKSGKKMLDIQIDEDIPVSQLNSHIDMKVHGTSHKYSESFYSVNADKLVR